MYDLCLVQHEYGVKQRGWIRESFTTGKPSIRPACAYTQAGRNGESRRTVLAFSPLRYGPSGLLRTGGGSPRSHERACAEPDCERSRSGRHADKAWHPRCRILSGDPAVALFLWPQGGSAPRPCCGLREERPDPFINKFSSLLGMTHNPYRLTCVTRQAIILFG